MLLAKTLIAGGGVLAVAGVSIADAGGQLTISSLAIAFTGIALVWFGSTMLKMRDDVITMKETLSHPENGIIHKIVCIEEEQGRHQDEINKLKYGRRSTDNPRGD